MIPSESALLEQRGSGDLAIGTAALAAKKGTAQRSLPAAGERTNALGDRGAKAGRTITVDRREMRVEVVNRHRHVNELGVGEQLNADHVDFP